MTLRIAVYDDRVEIENPGILLPGLIMDDVRQGVSKLRNKVIGRVFREAGLIEQWGSGIRRIFDEAQTLGLPEPKIEEIGMRLRFTVYLAGSFPIPHDTGEATGEVTGEATGEATPHVTAEATAQAAAEVWRLLMVMQGDMKRMEIQAALRLKHEDYFREAYLVPALRAGLIEMTIPDKPRSGNQKYRLTEAGRLARNAARKNSKA